MYSKKIAKTNEKYQQNWQMVWKWADCSSNNPSLSSADDCPYTATPSMWTYAYIIVRVHSRGIGANMGAMGIASTNEENIRNEKKKEEMVLNE